MEAGGLFSYYYHLESQTVRWDAPDLPESNPLWQDEGVDVGLNPDNGRPFYQPAGTNEVTYDSPLSLELVIAAVYSTTLQLYSEHYITTFFALISDEPSAQFNEEANGLAAGSRTVLWYLKCVGECWDSVIFDPSHQDSRDLIERGRVRGFPKTHYHQRAAGFMGFSRRKDAEEYLHLLFQWDREQAKNPEGGIDKLTSEYTNGPTKTVN